MYTIELFISFYKTNLWARSSDWESAALARQRPRVQIPVGPLNTLCIFLLVQHCFVLKLM